MWLHVPRVQRSSLTLRCVKITIVFASCLKRYLKSGLRKKKKKKKYKYVPIPQITSQISLQSDML